MKDQRASSHTVDGLVKQSCRERRRRACVRVAALTHKYTQEVTHLQLQQGQTLPLRSTKQQGLCSILAADQSECCLLLSINHVSLKCEH